MRHVNANGRLTAVRTCYIPGLKSISAGRACSARPGMIEQNLLRDVHKRRGSRISYILQRVTLSIGSLKPTRGRYTLSTGTKNSNHVQTLEISTVELVSCGQRPGLGVSESSCFLQRMLIINEFMQQCFIPASSLNNSSKRIYQMRN